MQSLSVDYEELEYLEMARIDVVEERVNNHIKFFWGVAATFAVWLCAISVILFNMNGSLNTLRLPQRLEQSSAHPENKQNQDQADSLLNQAQSSSISIPESVIQSAGTRFIEASETNPDAWSTALHFLQYRSYLNVYVRAFRTVAARAGTSLHYDIGPRVDGEPLPQLSFVPEAVSPEDAARLETIGQNLNQQMNVGAPELYLTGGAFSIDDKYMKHVVLEGVEVHYTGKPVTLEDVIFVNCTFEMENTDQSRKLGHELLASSPVNFAVPS